MLNYWRFAFCGWRYYQENLFCKIQVKTTEEIFCITTEYLENENLEWEYCINICTDGAAAIMGRSEGFVSGVKERNQTVISKHYFLHRKALVFKIYQQI